jgi:hypothetical protein
VPPDFCAPSARHTSVKIVGVTPILKPTPGGIPHFVRNEKTLFAR